MFFYILIDKNTSADRIFFFNLVNASNFDWKFYVFKIKLFTKSLSAILILAGLQSAGFKYLTLLNLKH